MSDPNASPADSAKSLEGRSYRVLVNYPDGSSDVQTLSEPPLRGALVPDGWVVTDVAIRRVELDGEPIHFEAYVQETPGTSPPSA